MKNKMLRINEVAKLTGITVRTLHYYDEIGLLSPSEITETGYRLYDEHALDTLQQILFFRELEFPLSDIKEIMSNPGYNKQEALLKHKELLLLKRTRMDELIQLIEKSIKGEKSMSFKEFDTKTIDECKNKYAKEVKERWGNTEAYAESEKKTASYDDNKWSMVNGGMDALIKEFSAIRNESPESEQAQELVKKWQAYITENFYNCTDDILSGLGQMYT